MSLKKKIQQSSDLTAIQKAVLLKNFSKLSLEQIARLKSLLKMEEAIDSKYLNGLKELGVKTVKIIKKRYG